MHMHVNHLRNQIVCRMLTSVLLPVMLVSSCKDSKNGSGTNQESCVAIKTEYYHADNDIAMTIRSLADAMKVGESIDSTDYDFKGVLTDGQGSPLYTDVQGSPGMWVVDVLDEKNVTIKNIYLGDLLPADLQSYILQSLHLSEDHQMDFTAHDAVNDDETEISVFDFGGGYLRFEIRAGIAPNGLEGPLLTIVMSVEPPAGAERRTDGLARNEAKP